MLLHGGVNVCNDRHLPPMPLCFIKAYASLWHLLSNFMITRPPIPQQTVFTFASLT